MAPKSILVINPNSTAAMTDGLKPLCATFETDKITFSFFTGPSSSPKSINNEDDAALSAKACLPELIPLLDKHDAFIAACYSHHPLVAQLKERTLKPVSGIFEASVLVSRALLAQEGGKEEAFGIVSTGKIWETLLSDAVKLFTYGFDSAETPLPPDFAGVETTGLTAVELHDAPAAEVRKKMKAAVKRLVARGSEVDGTPRKVRCICLGCAGMAGMDEMVREALVEELGEDKGQQVRIVDGVMAAAGLLTSLLLSGY